MFNFNSDKILNYRNLSLSLTIIPFLVLFSTISSSIKPVSSQILPEQSTSFISIWRRKPKKPLGGRTGSVCPLAPGIIDTYIVWSDRPLFLWQYSGTDEQAELIVRESGSKQNLWTKTVNLADKKSFYDAQKPLEPGKLYQWKLSGTSASGLFQIMPADERENIRQQLQALEKQIKGSKNLSEEIALKRATFFLNYEIKHQIENKKFNAWSDALTTLYQVEQPSKEFVSNRQKFIKSFCLPTNSNTSKN